jgi:hypothetical protein
MRNRRAMLIDPKLLMRTDKVLQELKKSPQQYPDSFIFLAEQLLDRTLSGSLRQNDDFLLNSLENATQQGFSKVKNSPNAVALPNTGALPNTVVNPLVKRLDDILAKSPNQFIDSLRNQVLRGRRLTQKQLDAIEKFEKPQTVGVVDDELLARIDTLRSSIDNPFLESVRQQVARGRKLSQKQLDAISRFETSRYKKASAVICAKAMCRAGIRISSEQDVALFISTANKALKRADALMDSEVAPNPQEVKEATARLDAKIQKEMHATDKYVWEKVSGIAEKLESFGYLTNISKREFGRFDLSNTEFYVLSSGQTLTFDDMVEIGNKNPLLRKELNALHGFHTFAKGVYTGVLDPALKKSLLGKTAGLFETIANFFRRPLVNILPAILGSAVITGAMLELFYGKNSDVSAITIGVAASLFTILGPHLLRWIASKAQGAFSRLKFKLASDNREIYRRTLSSFISWASY